MISLKSPNSSVICYFFDVNPQKRPGGYLVFFTALLSLLILGLKQAIKQALNKRLGGTCEKFRQVHAVLRFFEGWLGCRILSVHHKVYERTCSFAINASLSTFE